MSITGPFIYRPVMTTLVMMGILIFGLMGYRALPVSDLPTVDFPTIVVSANLPGAGLDSLNSVNTLGRTQITLQFNLNRNIDAAAQDVQAMIARASRDLPTTLP